jgi:hypothetical protein
VVLGGVIRVEAAAIIGLDDLEPLLVEVMQGQIVAIEVVENSEFHSPSLARLAPCLGVIIRKSPPCNKGVNCWRRRSRCMIHRRNPC